MGLGNLAPASLIRYQLLNVLVQMRVVGCVCIACPNDNNLLNLEVERMELEREYQG